MSNKIIIEAKQNIADIGVNTYVYYKPNISEIVKALDNIIYMNKTKHLYKSKISIVSQGITGKLIHKYAITKHKKYFTIIERAIYIDQPRIKINNTNSTTSVTKKYNIYIPNKYTKQIISNILSLYKLNYMSIFNYIKIK